MSVAEPAAVPPKRRWYQFSLRTLLLLPVVLALVLSAYYSWPYVQRRYIVWRLQDYVDKDLRKLPATERQRVDEWMSKLLEEGEDYGQFPMYNYESWIILAAKTPTGGWRMYVFQSDEDMSECRLCTIDSWGALRNYIGFILSSEESARFDDSRGFLCLSLEKYDGGMGEETRQYFRVTDECLEPLRIENQNGSCIMAVTNVFNMANDPPDWSEWQRLLESPERLQQLRGLAALFSDRNRTAQIDDKVHRRLEEIATSPDPWISEEAKLVLDEEKKE